MWYVWIALALVTCAGGDRGEEGGATATTAAPPHAPLRTLDREASDLVWHSWLQSADARDSNAPPRRITIKSIFIMPINCHNGQRYDGKGCVENIPLGKEEHERILREQLNERLTSGPVSSDLYDYGDIPLKMTIPIAQELQTSPLQDSGPSNQALESKPNDFLIDKPEDKDTDFVDELESLKLENNSKLDNETTVSEQHISHVLSNYISAQDKPKRDSSITDFNSNETVNTTDEGQKEVVFGNVSIDPVLYITEYINQQKMEGIISHNETNTTNIDKISNETQVFNALKVQKNDTTNKNETISKDNNLNRNEEKSKLSPESDYSDIGEAIKLISRYAEVTTDDNFSKNQKKYVPIDDGILGTRTKLQHRRNKFKPLDIVRNDQERTEHGLEDIASRVENPDNGRNALIYRYPLNWQNSPTPPPDYPFRHLQDYWPGRERVGGVYNIEHENPRRHHHSFPHNSMRSHGYVYADRPEYPTLYAGRQGYPGQYIGYPPHKMVQRRANHPRDNGNNQNLYNLLGLKHWFSSESAANR